MAKRLIQVICVSSQCTLRNGGCLLVQNTAIRTRVIKCHAIKKKTLTLCGAGWARFKTATARHVDKRLLLFFLYCKVVETKIACISFHIIFCLQKKMAEKGWKIMSQKRSKFFLVFCDIFIMIAIYYRKMVKTFRFNIIAFRAVHTDWYLKWHFSADL